MKVWGFTIVKNAEKFDYPVVESIQSILPICDKFLVLHGDSNDGTKDLLQKIKSPKLIIHDSIWDPSIREGGKILAQETNKAKEMIPSDVDWCFYIQADEVVHEKYLPTIDRALNANLENTKVRGLLLKYRHFYGSYDYIGMNSDWYKREIRIIRNDDAIYSYGDAQGFRMGNNKKIPVKLIDAYIHHYGWVKNPVTMQSKVRTFHKLWHEDQWIQKKMGDKSEYDFHNIDYLKKYSGAHPKVMMQRIKSCNWDFDYDLAKNKFGIKDQLKNWVKSITGITPGEYKNYILLD